MHTRFVSFFLKYNLSKDILQVLLQISVTIRFLLFSETRLHRCSIEDQLIWWPRISSEYKIQFSSCTLLLSGPSNPRHTWAELRCSRFTQHSPEVSEQRKEDAISRARSIYRLTWREVLSETNDRLPVLCSYSSSSSWSSSIDLSTNWLFFIDINQAVR